MDRTDTQPHQSSNETSNGGEAPAGSAAERVIGDELRVARLGFGGMRIGGEGIWGAPENGNRRIWSGGRA
jgi:hypothetical protein